MLVGLYGQLSLKISLKNDEQKISIGDKFPFKNPFYICQISEVLFSKYKYISFPILESKNTF